MNRLVIKLLIIFSVAALHAQDPYADSLLDVLPKQSGKERVATLNELAFALHRSKTKEAVLFGQEALKLAREINDSNLLANTLNDASIPLIIKGEFDKAIAFNLELLEIRKRFPDSIKSGSAYAKIAHAYQELGQFDNALSYYEKAKPIFEAKNDYYRSIQLKSNIANLLREIGRIDEALATEQEVLEFAREADDAYTLVNTLNNIGICYRLKGDFDMANTFYTEMLALAEESNITEAKAVAYQSMGVNYRAANQPEVGIRYYMKALAIYKEIDSYPGIAVISSNLGFSYIDLEKLDSAELFLNESIRYSRLTKSLTYIEDAYMALSGLYEAKGDFKSASLYKDSVIAVKDSIFTQEGNELAAEMFQKYQAAEKEKEITEQQLELSKQRNQLVLLTGIIGFILLIFYFLFYRQRQKQKHLRTELHLKEVLAKQELIEKLQDERLRLSRDLHDSLGAELTLISSSADNQVYLSKDEEVKSTFQKLGDVSRNAVSILRDTIWAIRKDALDVEEFSVKLIQFIQQRQSLMNIDVENSIKDEILLTPSQSLNLFRVCQEVIHNAIKHSNASNMLISFKNDDKHVYVQLKDNGKGMGSENASGYGMTNMKERITEINGVIHFSSEEGQGVTVEITLPREVK